MVTFCFSSVYKFEHLIEFLQLKIEQIDENLNKIIINLERKNWNYFERPIRS